MWTAGRTVNARSVAHSQADVHSTDGRTRALADSVTQRRPLGVAARTNESIAETRPPPTALRPSQNADTNAASQSVVPSQQRTARRKLNRHREETIDRDSPQTSGSQLQAVHDRKSGHPYRA